MQPVLPPHDPTGFPADALALVVSPVNVTTSGSRWSCLQPVPGSAGETSNDEDDSDEDGSASSLPFPLRWGLPSRGRGGPSALLPLLKELLAPLPWLLASSVAAARPCNNKMRNRARAFKAAQTRGLLGEERCMAESFLCSMDGRADNDVCFAMRNSVPTEKSENMDDDGRGALRALSRKKCPMTLWRGRIGFSMTEANDPALRTYG
jgi:hypothetical protein